MIFRKFCLCTWILLVVSAVAKNVTAFQSLSVETESQGFAFEFQSSAGENAPLTKVYLGDNADPYPFIATVAAVDSNGTVAETLCTASLIDADNIMTAGHCIGFYEQWRNRAGYTVEAWIGTNDLRDSRRNWQRIPLAANSTKAPNSDMAIQRLAKSVRFTKVDEELPAAAICIGTFTKTTPINSTLIGYGWTDCPNPNVDGKLHIAKGSAYGYSSGDGIYAILYNSKGKQASGAPGDSGSPMFTISRNLPVQVAVTTGVRRCGNNGCPCIDGKANTYGVKPGYHKTFIQKYAPGAKFCPL